MKYQLHLNRDQKEALRILIPFWENKGINDVANRIFEFHDKRRMLSIELDSGDYYLKDLLQAISIELAKLKTDKWNKNLLIQNTNVELDHIARMMGKMIFYWYEYIKYEYKAREEGIIGVDKIYWTPHGTIDADKIFKLSWLGNPTLDITEVYNFACRHAITDHINDLWNKIPKDMQVDCYKDIYKRFDQHILAYWKHLRDNDLPNLMTHLQVAANNFNERDVLWFNYIYDLNRSTEENMLWLSVHEGYFNNMKYFWDQLTEQERDESVLKCARIAVLRYSEYNCINDNIYNYKRSQCVEIYIFSMNQMSKDHKKAFFNEKMGVQALFHMERIKLDIFEMLLFVWPWQELFIPVLKDMIQYGNNSSMAIRYLLCAIEMKMVTDDLKGYALKTSKYHVLLREAWLIIPACNKQIIESSNFFLYYINNLINIWDLDNLDLMLNDPEMAHVRDEFINLGSCSYKKLVLEDKFDKLNQFINKILKSDNEIKRFKQRIICWDHFIMQDEIYLADKLLDWQSSTPEERQSLKNKIDAGEICKLFIGSREYKLADKFLNWKFDTEEEKRHFRNILKKDDRYVVSTFYNLWWEENSKISFIHYKDACSKFLHWVFESEEEIAFFIFERIVKLVMGDSRMGRELISWDQIEDFLRWCVEKFGD